MAPHSETNGSNNADGSTTTSAIRGKFPRPPTFEDKHEEREYVKGRLALAFRIFGKYGYDEGLAGHMTVRDPVTPNLFWTNPVGVAFSLMKRSDLLLVDYSGNVVDGGEERLVNTAGYLIHSAVHKARPDVMAAAHSHSINGRTFATLGRPLDCLTQDSCAFFDDHVVHDSFSGVVLDADEGTSIAKRLGGKKAAILQNHGLLTVGHSIEETVFWFVSMEKCCYTQLMAEAAASSRGQTPIKINDEAAAVSHKTVGSHMAGWFSAKPMFDVVHKETKGEYLN